MTQGVLLSRNIKGASAAEKKEVYDAVCKLAPVSIDELRTAVNMSPDKLSFVVRHLYKIECIKHEKRGDPRYSPR